MIPAFFSTVAACGLIPPPDTRVREFALQVASVQVAEGPDAVMRFACEPMPEDTIEHPVDRQMLNFWRNHYACIDSVREQGGEWVVVYRYFGPDASFFFSQPQWADTDVDVLNPPHVTESCADLSVPPDLRQRVGTHEVRVSAGIVHMCTDARDGN